MCGKKRRVFRGQNVGTRSELERSRASVSRTVATHRRSTGMQTPPPPLRREALAVANKAAIGASRPTIDPAAREAPIRPSRRRRRQHRPDSSARAVERGRTPGAESGPGAGPAPLHRVPPSRSPCVKNKPSPTRPRRHRHRQPVCIVNARPRHDSSILAAATWRSFAPHQSPAREAVTCSLPRVGSSIAPSAANRRRR